VSTSRSNPRSSVPEPRSGEDLILLPLESDETVDKDQSWIARGLATAAVLAIVCGALLTAYRNWSSDSVLRVAGSAPADTTDNTRQVATVPVIIDLSPAAALPAPSPIDVPRSSDQRAASFPGWRDHASASPIRQPREGDRAREPASTPIQLAGSVSSVDPEGQRRRLDTTRSQSAQRQGTRITPPVTGEATSIELRRTRETIATLTALIKNEDFAKAVNTAVTFREANPGLARSHAVEFRELLQLQRTATERYFKAMRSSGRLPADDTGDLDVAAIDHDLMTLHLQAAMPTFALDHFRNAEEGYNRALSAARQRERSASGTSSAKRDIQQITENLGLLYASWAEHKPDVTMLRKADAAFQDSERLLDYADEPSSARGRLMDGKAILEQARRRLR